MRQAGQPHSRWHRLGHTGTSDAAVVVVIAGALLGVLGAVLTPFSTQVFAGGAVVSAGAVFGGLLADQERRRRRVDDSVRAQFLPNGALSTPPASGHDTASGHGDPLSTVLVGMAAERPSRLTTLTEAR
jgi:hypothetical protein